MRHQRLGRVRSPLFKKKWSRVFLELLRPLSGAAGIYYCLQSSLKIMSSVCPKSCGSCGALYVHQQTLNCFVENNCVPCLYKIINEPTSGHGTTAADCPPNVRPEQCLRSKATNARESFTGLYSKKHSLLTVGDGDLSFSLSLMKCGKRKQLTATTYESLETLISVYPTSQPIIVELSSMHGVTVLHGVDATNLSLSVDLPKKTFDVVIWNFPCIRANAGADGQVSEIDINKNLLRSFFSNVRRYLKPNGPREIHITHKTIEPFSWWNIVGLAEEAGLYFIGSVVFDR